VYIVILADITEQGHIFKDWQERIFVTRKELAFMLNIDATILSTMACKLPLEGRSTLTYMERLIIGISNLSNAREAPFCSREEVEKILRCARLRENDVNRLMDALSASIPLTYQLSDEQALKQAEKSTSDVETLLKTELGCHLDRTLPIHVKSLDKVLRGIRNIAAAHAELRRNMERRDTHQ
jgi:hypothetical protein